MKNMSKREKLYNSREREADSLGGPGGSGWRKEGERQGERYTDRRRHGASEAEKRLKKIKK